MVEYSTDKEKDVENMPRFFICDNPGKTVILGGADSRHIAKSLRMQPGEELILCNGEGTDFLCEIIQIQEDTVMVAVKETQESRGEPSLAVTVYQGLPKSDKMDFIAQKVVEMGAVRLVPTMTNRCVSRPDAKSADKKLERWQKIAEEAAKQCGRGKIPQVTALTDFQKAILQAEQDGEILLFYEGGGASLREWMDTGQKQLSIFIGPEGGFAQEEVAFAQQHGAWIGSLGARILRTETASIAALAALMLASGNL